MHSTLHLFIASDIVLQPGYHLFYFSRKEHQTMRVASQPHSRGVIMSPSLVEQWAGVRSSNTLKSQREIISVLMCLYSFFYRQDKLKILSMH